jgi:hypothetical protein
MWIERIDYMAKSGVLSQRITTSMHNTTHIDAPAHVVGDTPFIDEVPLPHFFGTGIVVSIPKKMWRPILVLAGGHDEIASGMAKQAARRRDQNDLAAIALRQHLPASGPRDQPALRDIRVHNVEEAIRRHFGDLEQFLVATLLKRLGHRSSPNHQQPSRKIFTLHRRAPQSKPS